MAIHLGRLPKYHDGKDELEDMVPDRAGVYALDPDAWERTFYSLTNKDLKSITRYKPAIVKIPSNSIVGDMAIANQFYRTNDADEKQAYAKAYRDSLVPYGSNTSHMKMPEIIMPRLIESVQEIDETSPIELAKRFIDPVIKHGSYEKAAKTLYDILNRKKKEHGKLRHGIAYYAQQLAKSFSGVDYRALEDYLRDHYDVAQFESKFTSMELAVMEGGHSLDDLEEGKISKALGTAAVAGALAFGSNLSDKLPSTSDIANTDQAQVTQTVKQDSKTSDYNPITNSKNEVVLAKTAQANGIKDIELAAFMAQMAHESENFSDMVEDNPNIKKYAGKLAKVLGNKSVNDAERFIGRGYIQLTGRWNYEWMQKKLGIDLTSTWSKAHQASKPEVAAQIAVEFWKSRVRPKVSDWTDVAQVTKPINSRLHGLNHREARFEKIMLAMNEWTISDKLQAKWLKEIKVDNRISKTDVDRYDWDEYIAQTEPVTKIKGYEIHFIETRGSHHYLIKNPDDDGFLGELKLDKYRNYYQSSVFFDPEIQGKGLGLPLYVYVIKKGYTLVSDSSQSKGSREGIWKKLSQVPGIFVYAWDTKYDEFFQWNPEEDMDSEIYFNQAKLDQLDQEYKDGKINDKDYKIAKAELSQVNQFSDIRLVAISTKKKVSERLVKLDPKGPSNLKKLQKKSKYAKRKDALSQIDDLDNIKELKIEKPDTKDTMGIKRNKMPQIATKDYPEFIDYLKDNGASFSKDTINPKLLKAIQGEFSDAGVLKALKKRKLDKPIIASSDNYIIDGHHRWIAAMNTGVDVNIYRVNKPGKELLQLVNDFPKTTYKDIYEGVGIITAQNTTADVKPGETQRQAAKFGMKVDKNNNPPLLHKKAAKNSTRNKLFNIGIT